MWYLEEGWKHAHDLLELIILLNELFHDLFELLILLSELFEIESLIHLLSEHMPILH